MLTCSWSGSTAPGAKRISAVIRPVFGSIISVLTSQPGNRVGFHSMSAGLTRCECSSAWVCFGVTASMTILRVRDSDFVAPMIADRGGEPPVWRIVQLSSLISILKLDFGLFDHRGEFFALRRDEGAELLRAHLTRHDALGAERLRDLRFGQTPGGDLVVAVHHRGRRARRREQAEPVQQLVAFEL